MHGHPGGTSGPTAVAETHVSRLFFVGDRAYKLKKPVTTGFLDFSTVALRQRACEREVELNRRLAPDVYLGVATVLGVDGAPCDHLVVMRRLPDEVRLSRRVSDGLDVGADLRRIARVMADFHARAPTSPEISAEGSSHAVLARWRANSEQMRALEEPLLKGASLERVAALSERYLAGRAALFDRRIAEGRVRDGHGDLLADDIFCLDDGPRIIDCLEFDDHLRYSDVVEDAAFLAMDLERLGAPALGAAFLDAYREESRDAYPVTLGHHYIAYRAQVRAKVACLREVQGISGGRAEAARLLEMAERHLLAGRVRLVLVGGLPGTGKSTLAGALGKRLGWPVLRSDEVRRELAGTRAAGAAAGYREGIYDPAFTLATYRELLSGARRHLELGQPVILDASWTDGRRRDEASALAAATASDLVELRCEAPADVAAARIARRRAEGVDASEATGEVAARMALAEDPWPSAVMIDSTRGRRRALDRALEALGDRMTYWGGPPQ